MDQHPLFTSRDCHGRRRLAASRPTPIAPSNGPVRRPVYTKREPRETIRLRSAEFALVIASIAVALHAAWAVFGYRERMLATVVAVIAK